MQRDPLGYVDGLGLHEAFGGRPGEVTDPMGEENKDVPISNEKVRKFITDFLQEKVEAIRKSSWGSSDQGKAVFKTIDQQKDIFTNKDKLRLYWTLADNSLGFSDVSRWWGTLNYIGLSLGFPCPKNEEEELKRAKSFLYGSRLGVDLTQIFFHEILHYSIPKTSKNEEIEVDFISFNAVNSIVWENGDEPFVPYRMFGTSQETTNIQIYHMIAPTYENIPKNPELENYPKTPWIPNYKPTYPLYFNNKKEEEAWTKAQSPTFWK